MSEPPDDIVRRNAAEIPDATPEQISHLLAAMEGPIDTSELPETTGDETPIQRDADGRLLPRGWWQAMERAGFRVGGCGDFLSLSPPERQRVESLIGERDRERKEQADEHRIR